MGPSQAAAAAARTGQALLAGQAALSVGGPSLSLAAEAVPDPLAAEVGQRLRQVAAASWPCLRAAEVAAAGCPHGQRSLPAPSFRPARLVVAAAAVELQPSWLAGVSVLLQAAVAGLVHCQVGHAAAVNRLPLCRRRPNCAGVSEPAGQRAPPRR